jgi:phosphoglucomutase
MFCEVAAYAKSRGHTVDELLDQIFATFGYFAEKNGSLVFEGAEGANKIARLADSYSAKPFFEVLGSRVVEIKNFEANMIEDVEGDLIPKEKMSIFALEDGTRIAIRPSGTEPKIKYYLFAQRRPENGKFDFAQLSRIKAHVGEELNRLWDCLQKDAESRLSEHGKKK